MAFIPQCMRAFSKELTSGVVNKALFKAKMPPIAVITYVKLSICFLSSAIFSSSGLNSSFNPLSPPPPLSLHFLPSLFFPVVTCASLLLSNPPHLCRDTTSPLYSTPLPSNDLDEETKREREEKCSRPVVVM